MKRNLPNSPLKITKEYYDELYYGDNMTIREIAKHIGYSFSQTRRGMEKAGVVIKPPYKSMAVRQKYSEQKKRAGKWVGESNPNWRGGVALDSNLRNVSGLAYWRNTVKRRDSYTCQECGVDGRKACKCCGLKTPIHAHHIKSWKDHPDLRLDVDNGQTLCEKCHRHLHKQTE